jgi:hypothetical protein
MTDDIRYPDGAEDRSDNHQHVVKACEHALDVLRDGNLLHAQTLLDEARATAKRAQHDDAEQTYRETAYDCHE